MTIWAIVPVKPLRQGKSRLAGTLSEDQRTRLNRTLLEHTLNTLAEIGEIDKIMVVSRDPAALALARSHGARSLMEEGTPHLNTGLQRATAVARAHGAGGVLVLPADLPLISPREVRAILKRGLNPPVVVIAPDRREDGTNGLFMNPAGIIEYDFGPGSYRRHCERAEAAGASLEIVNRKALALDLDVPEDLDHLGGFDKLENT